MSQILDASPFGMNFTLKTHHSTYAEISPLSEPAPCDGRTVVIMDTAKEIGSAIAMSYARGGASRIAIATDDDPSVIRTQALQAAADAGRQGLEILVWKLDVFNRARVEAWTAEIISKWRHVDILVNNTARVPHSEALSGDDIYERWKILETNIRSVSWSTRGLLPALLQGTDKTVINLMPPGFRIFASAYQRPCMMAIMCISEYLLADYKQQGLLIYSVQPASVSIRADGVPKGVNFLSQQLTGDTIAYLSSNRREWLAGRCISCWWDMEEFMKKEAEVVRKDLLKLQITLEGQAEIGRTQRRMRVPSSSY